MLLQAGKALARTFREGRSYELALETYRFLADYSNYRDEKLILSQAQRDMWRLELEELQDIEAGRRALPAEAGQVWRMLWANFFQPEHRQGYTLDEILAQGLALCQASEDSDRPIEFFL